MNFILLISLLSQQIENPLQLHYATGNKDSIPENFTPLPNDFNPEIGEPYWVKIEISSTEEKPIVIQGGKWYMRNIHFFNQEGDFLKRGNHIIVDLKESISIFYIYYPFTDEKSVGISQIAIFDLLDFMEIKNQKNVVQASFQSILIFLILISSFFYFQNRDKVYIFYGLYLFSIMWFFGYQYGLLGTIIPIVNYISPMWFWLFPFTITLFYALFTIEYFHLKSVEFKAYKIIKWGIYYMLFLFALSALLYILKIDVQHSYFYKIPTITVEFILIGAALFRITKIKNVIKNYYLVGVFILLIASLGGQLYSTSQAMDNINYVIQAGLILEVFILSLGLGVRVDQIQKSHSAASKELIKQLKLNESLQNEYTSKLEKQVNKRTKSLLKRTEENEMLLKEVHHRVKNNLQVIISLMNMQERRVSSVQMQQMLSSTKNKVKSIALIHEHLYHHENFMDIQLDEYVEKLIKMLISNLHNGNEVKLSVKIPNINIHFEKAIHIGLVINELATNSIKYGFNKHENPELKINILENDSSIKMNIRDNGKNSPSDVNKTGLGFSIIQAIVEKNEGEFSFDQDENGFVVQVVMNM